MVVVEGVVAALEELHFLGGFRVRELEADLVLAEADFGDPAYGCQASVEALIGFDGEFDMIAYFPPGFLFVQDFEA